VYGFCAKFHLANISNTNNLNPGGLRSSRVQSLRIDTFNGEVFQKYQYQNELLKPEESQK
jgi:hypothetical protein